MLIQTLPEKCASACCPNKPGEGRFHLIVEDTEKWVVLLLCYPCAHSLGFVE